jgi:Ca-activated chloride channel family protein
MPGLTAFFWWAWRRKKWLISQFVRSRLLANLTVGVSAGRQKVRMALIVSAVGLLIVVLARPQWGFSWEEAKQRGLDVVVAIDTSKSMLADDVAPNRLARAKLAALDLKRLARTDRVGLVAFAGSAFLQCPLSVDDEAFRQSVNALDINIIPQGGTALAEAIQTARSAFKEKNDNHKVLVLFTDGEDHDGRALEAAREAAKEGLRIFCIGIGTAAGEMLRTYDAKGRGDFIRDRDGNAVKSRLNEALLRQIAQSNGGFYMLLSGANTIDLLYERGLAPLPKSEFSARQIKRHHERYQWFLGLVIALLLVEMFLPERRPVRKTEGIVDGSANAELRKAVALLMTLMLPPVAWASPDKALKQYESGRYSAALREYERSLRERPEDPRLRYNAGAAAFKNADYDEASTYFESALQAPGIAEDLPLQQRAYYNLGNAQYRQGENETNLERKQSNWQQALKSYEQALQLDSKDADAKFNYDLVKAKLEELQQQQQQKPEDIQPSEEAKRAKAQADEAVRRKEYQRALEIMDKQLQRDSTTRYYGDYIQRLREINGIQDSGQR